MRLGLKLWGHEQMHCFPGGLVRRLAVSKNARHSPQSGKRDPNMTKQPIPPLTNGRNRDPCMELQCEKSVLQRPALHRRRQKKVQRDKKEGQELKIKLVGIKDKIICMCTGQENENPVHPSLVQLKLFQNWIWICEESKFTLHQKGKTSNKTFCLLQQRCR